MLELLMRMTILASVIIGVGYVLSLMPWWAMLVLVVGVASLARYAVN